MKTSKAEKRGANQAHLNKEAGPKAMSSWLERQASSHHVQLVASALLSGVAVAGLIYGGQAIRRRAAVDELKASIPELDESYHSEPVNKLGLRQLEYTIINNNHPSEAHKFWHCFIVTSLQQRR